MQKVLFLLSEHGYWGEELVGPLEALEAEGVLVEFATPKGKRPHALPPSMDPEYVDPPLGRTVVSAEMAAKVKRLDVSNRLAKPISLAAFMKERPYLSSHNYLWELEAYYESVAKASEALDAYCALLIIGGNGPIVDLVNNQRVHEVIMDFHRKNKPIAAECYGVACLAFARDWNLRQSILAGKHVTGHPLEYDYKDGIGFYGTDFNMGPPPYPLEYILRDAVAPGGAFHGNVGQSLSVIVDYPFITGRSTADSRLTGEMLIQVLNHGLKTFGF